MRFKIIFFSSLVLFFSLFIVNYYFIRSDYKKSNIERQNKRLDIIKKFSIIIREAFIRNDNDILDIENFLKFIKKTNSDISYIYVFDKDGKIIATNYIKKEKFNHIKLKYVFSKKVVNDFFVDKKFYLNDEYKKSNILYKDYFLINNNQLINEFTYFVTFNRDLISIIKIGFMDTEIKRAYFLNSKTFAYKDLRISISLFILGIMAFFLITYRVNNFIADLKKAIKFLGEGKFDTRINFDYEGEFKELASEFNKMAARLKEIDILKQDFISNITHELRSPLGAIESYLNFMISEDEELGIDKKEVYYESLNLKERYEYFVRMKNNTKRLRNFINNILDIAKVESGNLILDKKMANINLIIEDVTNLFLLKAKEKNLKIESQIDDLIDSFYFDIEKIKQVLIILIDNAIKFSYSGGIIKIKVSYLYNGEKLSQNVHSVLIEVKDTGIGIPDDSVNKIFDKFEQVKGSSKDLVQAEKGTGLGLSIAKGIIELHNGKIWVETIFGKGTTFFIKLPTIFVDGKM